MDIVNEEMAAAWDGPEGSHWAANARRYERASRRHLEALLARADIGARDSVLDIGCGAGASTREVARRAERGAALGIDLSAEMLSRAREAAAADGLANVTFVQADAQVHPFEPAVHDVAISAFGAMFFADPVAAFRNIGGSIRPGGRLALVAWRELAANEWLVALRSVLAAGRQLPEPPAGAPGPFGLADADRTRQVLAAAGFSDVALEPVDEPMDWGVDADDAFAFVSDLGMTRGLLGDLDEEARQLALASLRATLAERQTSDGVLLGSAAWLITASR